MIYRKRESIYQCKLISRIERNSLRCVLRRVGAVSSGKCQSRSYLLRSAFHFLCYHFDFVTKLKNTNKFEMRIREKIVLLVQHKFVNLLKIYIYLTPTNSLFQLLRKVVLSCTNLVKQPAVFIQSTLMVQVPLMYSVTKQHPVGGGQCSKREKMVPLISTATGMTIRVALAI